MKTDNAFRRLLVIDDNEAIHNDFRKIFAGTNESDDHLKALDAELFGTEFSEDPERLDYELSFASQGKDGYEIVKKSLETGGRFGAAFVDMRMPPGWDGVETIEHLWQVDPDLQLVICTAYSDHSWKDISARLGVTDQLLILKKPFDEVEVIQLAASLTNKRKLLARSRSEMKRLEQVVVDQDAQLHAAHQNAEHLISSISSALASMDVDGAVIGENVRYVANSLEELRPALEFLKDVVGSNVIDSQICEPHPTALDDIKPNEVRSVLDRIPDALSESIAGVEAVSKIVHAMRQYSQPVA